MIGYRDTATVAPRDRAARHDNGAGLGRAWPVGRPLGEGLVVAGCLRGLAESGAAPARRIPIIGCAQAGDDGFFDDAGYPVGAGWDDVAFPDFDDPHAYALEVSGDSMAPAYRDGDIVIVSPAASVRRGDRVVVKTAAGEIMVKELARRTARKVELDSLNPEHPGRALAARDIAWLSRIVWVSQ